MKLFKGPVPQKPWRPSASVIIAAPAGSVPSPALCSGLGVVSQTDYRICMLKRHGKSSFMGNAVVFPGGAYDAEDGEVAEKYFPGEGAGGKVCAAREAFEEAGVVLVKGAGGGDIDVAKWRKTVHDDSKEYGKMLEAHKVRPGVEGLDYWCQFTTPDVEAARVKKGGFKTEFYLTCVDGTAAKTYSCDRAETTDLLWLSPEECLSAHTAGLIYLPPPQWTIMTELTAAHSLRSLPAYTRSPSRSLIRDHPIKPYLLVPNPKDVLTMAYPGDALHPIYPTTNGVRRITIHKTKGITMECNLPADAKIKQAAKM